MKRHIITTLLLTAALAWAQRPIENPENAKEFWEHLSDAADLDEETRTALREKIGALAEGEVDLGDIASAADLTAATTPAAIADRISEFAEGNRVDALAGLLLHRSHTNGAAILPKASRRIQETSQLSFDPFRLSVVFTGDSFAVNLAREMSRKTGQPVAADGMGHLGVKYTQEGTVGVSGTDFTRSPHGFTALLNGSPDALIYPPNQNDSYKVQVFYSKQEGVPGVFTLQSSTNGGAWTTVPGASAIDVEGGTGTGITAGVFEHAFSDTALRRYRALWVSGNVKIIGMTRSNVWTGTANKGGIANFDLSYSGQKVSESNLCPQAVWDVVFGALQPDIITFKADDNAADIAALAGVIEKATAAYSQSDWILFSQHPTGTKQGIALQPEDMVVKGIADSGKHLFINGRSIMPSYAEMVALGMLNGDNYHLNSIYGTRYLERISVELLGRQIFPAGGESGNTTTNFSLTGPTHIRRVVQGRGKNGPGASVMSESVYPDGTNMGYQINIGSSDVGRMAWSRNGRALVTGDTQGFGYTFPPAPPGREPNAQFEITMGGSTTRPALALSGSSSHSTDLLRLHTASSNATLGARVAGIDSKGKADFVTVRTPAVTVAGLAALPTPTAGDRCFVSDANVAHAGNSGTIVAGGGANFVPVYFDGTNWRID